MALFVDLTGDVFMGLQTPLLHTIFFLGVAVVVLLYFVRFTFLSFIVAFHQTGYED